MLIFVIHTVGRIQTRIDAVEGDDADHLTTTTAQTFCLIFILAGFAGQRHPTVQKSDRCDASGLHGRGPETGPSKLHHGRGLLRDSERDHHQAVTHV